MGKLRLKPLAFVPNSYTNNYWILPLNNSLAVFMHISITILLLDPLAFIHIFICLCILSNYVLLVWKAGTTATLPHSLPSLSLPSYLPPFFLKFLSCLMKCLIQKCSSCLFFVIIWHLTKTLASLGTQLNQAKTHKVKEISWLDA